MDKETQIGIENQIIDILNDTKPRPDLVECLKILHNIQDAFIGHLEENFQSAKKDAEDKLNVGDEKWIKYYFLVQSMQSF